jgi:hypothetical protein
MGGPFTLVLKKKNTPFLKAIFYEMAKKVSIVAICFSL